MRTWDLPLELPIGGEQPLFLAIARAITDEIRRGRLRPGMPLPGTRSLARQLAVHRNTTVAAYEELRAEGWIEAASGHGTQVSDKMPDASPRRFARRAPLAARAPERVGFELRPGPPPVEDPAPAGALQISGGVPDLRLVPRQALARAYRRALARVDGGVLAYGDPRGHRRLRAAIAELVSTKRGLVADAERVLVTRGSQMALDLVARALIAPGDVVAVESWGYRPAWEALARAGAELVPLPVDGSGVSVDALLALAARRPLRAVYLTPHHQYPTTVTLAAGRRLALLEAARRLRLAVVEDDYDHEFHYDGRPVLPLASADDAGCVVYVGTLSKVLAPGLRLGYVVAPRALVERLAALRLHIDRQGDQAVEHAVAELLEDGEAQRHVRRARRIYLARRDRFVELLRGSLGGALEFAVPPGGMALWARVSGEIDATRWQERAVDKGLALHPARRFAFDGRDRNFLRLGFAALDEGELAEAVKRLKAALPRGRHS